jgi:PAS domain-containing protein
MLGKLEHFSEVLSLRNASIRAKLMFAFLGVLLLLLPQIVLTVAYMVDFSQAGERIHRSAQATMTAGQLHRQLREALNRPFPRQESDLVEQVRVLDALAVSMEEGKALFDGFRAKDGRFGPLAKEIATLQEKLIAYAAALPAPARAMIKRTPPRARIDASSAQYLRLKEQYQSWQPDLPHESLSHIQVEAYFSSLKTLAIDVVDTIIEAQHVDDKEGSAQAREDAQVLSQDAQARATLLALADGLRARITEEGKLDGGSIQASVDAANRILITLVLLTLVYIFVIVLVLPSRLVRPLVHVSSVLEHAATGQLDVRARVVGDDEMGELGGNLNLMLERLGSFDRLKRDRIYEDAGRIKALAELIPTPMAILDTDFSFEYVNAAMQALLGLEDAFLGRRLTDVMGGRDAADLVAILDKSLERRRGLDGLEIHLKVPSGEAAFTLRTQLGRNRLGQVSYLICTLESLS